MCSCTHHIQLQRSIAVQQQASWQTAHDLHYFVQRHAVVYVMALNPYSPTDTIVPLVTFILLESMELNLVRPQTK